MNPEEMIEWINNASYEELLFKWRFQEPGSIWFTGDVGEHFQKVFFEKRNKLPRETLVAASKLVGWNK